MQYVAHHIFLSDDQMEVLTSGGEVCLAGFCTKVGIKNGEPEEPAKEIFCEYRINVNPFSPRVLRYDRGFIISFDNVVQAKSLLPVRRGGSGSLTICHKEIFDKAKVIHQICMSPASVLGSTALSLQRSHISFSEG